MSEQNNMVTLSKNEYLDKMLPEMRESEERFLEEFGVSQNLEHLDPLGEDLISIPVHMLNDDALMNLTEKEKKTLNPIDLEDTLKERGLQNNSTKTIDPEFDTSAYEEAKRSVLEKQTNSPAQSLNKRNSQRMRPSNI